MVTSVRWTPEVPTEILQYGPARITQMGWQNLQHWQCFWKCCLQSLPLSVDSPLPQSSGCSFITATDDHVPQTNFTNGVYHCNFWGKSCEFFSCASSYLEQNKIFWTILLLDESMKLTVFLDPLPFIRSWNAEMTLKTIFWPLKWYQNMMCFWV